MDFSISATIILISKDKKALILQRNSTDSFPNKWTVPGGKIEQTDGDFTHDVDACYYPAEYSAVREVEEETGIKVNWDKIEFLCSLYLKKINRFIISFYLVLDTDSKDIPVVLADNRAYING